MKLTLAADQVNGKEYNIVFYYDESFDQVWVQIVDPSSEKVVTGRPESDPEYRINNHFNGDTEKWLVEEYLPKVNAMLTEFFGKEDNVVDPSDWREVIKNFFRNSVAYNKETGKLEV